MPNVTASMGLKIPIVNETDYPTSISDSFTSIDGHDHSVGQGDQIPTGGIVDLAITTAKINTSAVTTAKIADLNVTRAKLEALGHQVSASSGLYTSAVAGIVDVTNLTVTITTTGRPVYVGLIAVDSAAFSRVRLAFVGVGNQNTAHVHINRGGATLVTMNVGRIDQDANNQAVHFSPGAFTHIDVVAAGTYTYKIQHEIASTAVTIDFSNVKLIAYEL